MLRDVKPCADGAEGKETAIKVPKTEEKCLPISGSSHRAADFLPTTRRMHLNSSLIASWRSDAAQAQAQSGSEPNEKRHLMNFFLAVLEIAQWMSNPVWAESGNSLLGRGSICDVGAVYK